MIADAGMEDRIELMEDGGPQHRERGAIHRSRYDRR